MAARMDEVAETLRTEIGASLRGVFYGDFKTREYTVAYANESVLTEYSPDETEQIVDDIALEQVGTARQETLFEPIGSLRFTVRYFEDGINLMAWGFEDVPTVYIGLDEDVRNVPVVIERLRALSGTDD
jgi:hypothetical protein